jgi:DNA-binding NarL/FixJ family response regulator
LNRPRVLLADDHPHFVEAETALLKSFFEVLGTAPDGVVLISEALRLDPDVIVTDITMPRLNGIEAAHRLRESGLRARIVFLTVHSAEEFVTACRQEGALGFVHKSRMKAHLIPAIHAVLAGQSYISVPDSV